MEKMKELIPYIVILIVVILVKSFIASPIRVNGTSMVPTLHPKDIMILNRTAYYTKNPKRFDIVVVDLEDEKVIKRVIGLPGDYVEIKDGSVYINGEKLKEDYLKAGVVTDMIQGGRDVSYFNNFTVPENCVFAMGDNRPGSTDCRSFGCIPLEKIEGKVLFRFWPFSKFGGVD